MTTEEPTPLLRWKPRKRTPDDQALVLQQRLKITEYSEPDPKYPDAVHIPRIVNVTYEWRDVPTVTE